MCVCVWVGEWVGGCGMCVGAVGVGMWMLSVYV